jgi:hypothetical protein
MTGAAPHRLGALADGHAHGWARPDLGIAPLDGDDGANGAAILDQGLVRL